MKTQHTLRAMLATVALAALTVLPASGITLEGKFNETTRYVSKSGSDTNGGTSWDDAKLTIQAAVDLCADGDTVIVDDGEYDDVSSAWTSVSDSTKTLPQTVVNITNRIHLVSRNGKFKTHIVGKWADTDTGVGTGAHRCIYINGTASSKDAANGTLIEGFTIRDGATEESNAGNGNTDLDSASGICGGTGNNGTGLAYVVDCDIVNCRAGRGAAISRGIVPIRCAFVGNRGVHSVSIEHVFFRTLYAYNCVFAMNGPTTRTVNAQGGSIFAQAQTATILNCTFIDNTCYAMQPGSAVNSASTPSPVYNCAFLGDGEALSYGSGGAKQYIYPTNCVQTASGTDIGGRIAKLGSAAGDYVGVSEYQHWFAADTGEWTFVENGDLKDKGFNARSVAAAFVPEEYLDTDFFGNPRDWDSVDIGAIEAQGDAADPALGYIRLGTNVAVRTGTTIHELPRGLVSVASDTVQARIVPTLGDSQQLFGYAVSGDWGSFYRYPDLVGDNGAWITPPGTTSNVVVNARAASAETWVDGSYAGGDSDGTSAKPYTTIQDAVNNTAAYGLVHVAPGTYATGGTTLSGHSVFSRVGIDNHIAIRSTGGAAATVIDGKGEDRCVAVRRQALSVHLQGFTIKDGFTDVTPTSSTMYHDAGAGFWVTVQTWNSTSGLASQYQLNAQVSDCVFVGNTARYGAAMCGGWAQRCTFTGNKIGETINNRGAVALNSVLSSCLVTNNLQSNTGSICSIYRCLPYNVTFAEAKYTDGVTSGNPNYRPIDQNTPTYNCAFFGGYIDVNRPTGTIATVGDIGDTSLTFISDWISIYRTRKLFIDAPAGDLHLRPVTDAYTKGDGSAYCADKFAVGDFEGNALAYVDGNPVPGAYSTLVGPAEDPFVITIR